MFRRTSILFLISVIALIASSRHHKHKRHHELCERITEPLCQGIGYNFTKVPENDEQFQSQKDMVDPIIAMKLDSVINEGLVNCSKNLQLFLCSLYLPMCTELEGFYEPISPCKSTCQLAKHKCQPILSKLMDKKAWKHLFHCDAYPDSSVNQLCLKNMDEQLYLSSS